MKKRTAFIGAILSLISLGQPLLIKTGVGLSTKGLFIALDEKVYAGDNSYYFNRAIDKGEKGDYYGAISDFTKAIKINPNDSQAYYNRGWNKGKLKDYYGAISDFTKAIEINPKMDKAYGNRGIVKRKIGDDKGGCDDWRKASSLGNKITAQWVRDQC